MRSSLSWLLASAAVVSVAMPAAAHARPFRFHYDHVLGTSLDVVAVASDETGALMAVTAIRREIARLDPILSAWREDSELQQLNRSFALKASPELYDVVARCEAWRLRTGGAFDCRTGGALALWREAEERGGQPFLDKTLASAGQPIGLDPARHVVRRGEGVRLTVDGMAKGYVIDAALAAARKASPNLKGLMIDIGGDLACWGQAPQASGWHVGVAGAHEADNLRPASTLRLNGGAVAASGRGARDLQVNGCALSHTLSPSTGRPVEGVRSAVVVAPKASDADALATAFMVMEPRHALALADSIPGVETLITEAGGARHASRGWGDLLVPVNFVTSGMAAAAAPGAVAPRSIGLDIGYQVPKIDAEPYHAPYVVMWVTDENRQMVRTLLVLGPKPKWAPENFVWWRRYGRQAPQVLDAVARPTRLPGRYAVHWDGKDETGQPAAAGKYILHIEASREKGGHTYQTVDIDLTGAGGAKALPAKDEMGAVDLKFGPAA